MYAELFALGTAVSFAVGNVVTRVALNRHQSYLGAGIAFFTAMVIVWAVVLIGQFQMPNSDALIWFVIRGLLDPGIAALLVFYSFQRLGVAITAPILAGSSLISTTLAVLWLQEQMTLGTIAGTVLIVVGVGVLTVKSKGGAFRPLYAGAALFGSALIGISAVLTKVGLDISNAPISGLAISLTVGVIVHISVAICTGWKSLPRTFEKTKLFIASGVFAALGFMGWYLATSIGTVSLVFPLISSQALLSVTLSAFLLKKYEKVTLNVFIGALLIVSGVVFLVH